MRYVLLVFDFEILSQIVDINFEVVNDQSRGTGVGYHVINVPAR